MRAVLATLCVLALAHGASAQSLNLHDADLPRGVATQLQSIVDDPATVRYEGPATIPAGTVVSSSVVGFDGLLTIAGRVLGHVIVVNADLMLEPGAEVTGDVTIVAGSLRGGDEAVLGGTVTVYGEGFSLYRGGERVFASRHWGRSRDRDGRHWGRSEFLVRIEDSYNRVEGLPLQFGPDLWTGGRSPLHVQALATWRTAAGGPGRTEEFGYVARAEQFVGRAFRLGASVRSSVEPIEDWTLSDVETSLAAALFHEDLLDHYEREGWSAYARLAPRGSPLDLTVEYRDERHATVHVRDPWTLFDRDDIWRAQPLVAEGDIQLVSGTAELDFRRGSDFGVRGWLVRGQIRHALGGQLETPANDIVAPRTFVNDFTTGTLDVRTYQRVGWDAVLGLRAVGGGSANRQALPPQFQHALGGAGSLPGYANFALDCGARRVLVRRGDDAGEQAFFPGYGCDRFALGQVEYRGGFDVHIGDRRRSDDWGWHVDSSVNWIVFFDAARGWAYDDIGTLDSGTLYDVGAGVILGGLGIYGAVPLSETDRGLRLFVRLGPRF